jgi:ribonuclease Z
MFRVNRWIRVGDTAMTTSITITGTGTPEGRPERAGAGVLVRSGDIALQFDAGRGTVMRLAGAGQQLTGLDALFITHHHSDHMVGVPDLVMTRWLDDVQRIGQPDLPIYAPNGEAAEIIERMLDVWQNEIAMRRLHTHRPNRPGMDVRRFSPSKAEPVLVAQFDEVEVSTISVEHDPVVPAVGYRIDTPDGSVVISGDTGACRQIAELSRDVDVLVHEAIRAEGLANLVSDPEALLAYHSECSEVGSLAQQAGVKQLILTHLVPSPDTPEEVAAFEADVRRGGYRGDLVVAEDLTTVQF